MNKLLLWFLVINYGTIPVVLLCIVFGVMPVVNVLIAVFVIIAAFRAWKRTTAAERQA